MRLGFGKATATRDTFAWRANRGLDAAIKEAHRKAAAVMRIQESV